LRAGRGAARLAVAGAHDARGGHRAGEAALARLRERGEVADWAPAGHAVRPGDWAQQAQATPDRIELALREDRFDDAAALGRDLVAGWIAVTVEELGESELGAVWRELQADGIAGYARYDVGTTPWEDSFAFAVQTAIEGMHGHLGGARGRGEVEVNDHGDRVE